MEDYSKSYNKLRSEGKELFRKKKFEDCIHIYTKAIDLCANDDKELSSCLINRALCSMKLNRYEDSIRDSAEAYDLNQTNPKPLYIIGKSYEQRGDYKSSLVAYKNMLIVDPSSAEGKAGVARLTAIIGDTEKIEYESGDILGTQGSGVVPLSKHVASVNFGRRAREKRASKEGCTTRSRADTVSDDPGAAPRLHPAVNMAIATVNDHVYYTNSPDETVPESDVPVVPAARTRHVYASSQAVTPLDTNVDTNSSSNDNSAASVMSPRVSVPPPHKQLKDVVLLLRQYDGVSFKNCFLLPSSWWEKWVTYVTSSIHAHSSTLSPSSRGTNSAPDSPSRKRTAYASAANTPSLPPPGPIDNAILLSPATAPADPKLIPGICGFAASSCVELSVDVGAASDSWEGNSYNGTRVGAEVDGENAATQSQSVSMSTHTLRLRPATLALHEKRDFVVIPSEVWVALHHWYGGGPELPVTHVRNISSSSDINIPGHDFELILGHGTEKDNQTANSQKPAHVSSCKSNCGANSVSAASTTSDSEDHYCNVCALLGHMRCSRCKAVYYCSSMCQTCDWPYHKAMCKAGGAKLEENPAEPPSRSYMSRFPFQSKQHNSQNLLIKSTKRRTCRGIAGLANLGNSCYLNSSVQCLSHTFPLTRHLLSCRYENDINKTSRDGTGGALVREFSSLLKDMWLRSFPSPMIQPVALRRLIGKVNVDYSSLQQQDAHDVLVFLLDRLHEDLNKIVKKPYVENSEGNGENDEEIGEESWKKHHMRHDSIVQDIVGGQLRSQIVCPYGTCKKKVVGFEYTSTVQLAIPNRNRSRSRSRSNSTGMYSYNIQDSSYLAKTVSIPIMFVPEFSTVASKKDDDYISISTLCQQLSTPVEVVLEEDVRSTVNTLRENLYEALMKCAKVKCGKGGRVRPRSMPKMEGDLVLMELEGAPVDQAAAGAVMTERLRAQGRGGIADDITTDPPVGWTVNRILDMNCRLSKVLGSAKATRRNYDGFTSEAISDGVDEPVNLVAYWLPESASTSYNAILLQRKIYKGPVDGPGNSVSMKEVGFRILGHPILLSYDIKWSCMRLRFSIWKQVCRALIDKGVFGLASSDGDTEDMQKQMRMANRLRIRLVDRVGNPLPGCWRARAESSSVPSPTKHSEEDEWVSNNGLNVASLSADERDEEDRSLMPSDHSVSVADFMGSDNNEIKFLCVDWVEGWCDFLNEDEVFSYMSLTKEGILVQPEPPLQESTSDDESSGQDTKQLVLKRAVADGVITLEECLHMFTSEEILDEANSWYCSNCKTHRQAFKTLNFWRLPKVLIIGLKRFETTNSMMSMYGMGGSYGGGMGVHREKINTFVDFPIHGLDMSPFCSPGRRRKKNGKQKIDDGDPYIYDLYAVINHYGRMGFGHYTAFARDWDGEKGSNKGENLWCSYDDDIIHVVDEKSVKTSAAYILFYRQRCSSGCDAT